MLRLMNRSEEQPVGLEILFMGLPPLRFNKVYNKALRTLTPPDYDLLWSGGLQKQSIDNEFATQ